MESISWPLEAIEPREVQLRALQAGLGEPGFAYFMRQRLGKTWTAYAEFKLLRDRGDAHWMVVICPNSIKEQWLEDIEKVDPYIPVNVYSSQKKKDTDYWFEKNKLGGVFIINYESVKSFYDSNGWLKFNPLMTYIVADESTKIADHTAKSTRACLEFSSICKYRRILSGKPSKGSNADLWSQLKFIGATRRTFLQHKHYFTYVGGYMGTQSLRDANTEILKAEMSPYCYIAEDKYVEGFKKVYEPLRKVELQGTRLAEMYRAMEKELVAEISSDIKMTAPIVLTKYLRLQQISSGIGGDEEGKHFNLVDPDKNPRIEAVKDIINNETGAKTIIVCRFRLSIENIKQELEKDGHNVAVMYGGMGAKLEENKKRFHEGDANVLIAQLQVLNFGHTLCGPDALPCEDMIFYENNFSLIDRAQCESRPEKMGRNRAISYWDFYASQMDRMMVQTLVRKEDASMALMGYAREKGILYKKPDSDSAILSNVAVDDALKIFIGADK